MYMYTHTPEYTHLSCMYSPICGWLSLTWKAGMQTNA